MSRNHCPAHFAVSPLLNRQSICVYPALLTSLARDWIWLGHNPSTCLMVWCGYPQEHSGVTPGAPIPDSHALRPSTSDLSRSMAVATCFRTPSYIHVGWLDQPSFQVSACRCSFAACDSHLLFHSSWSSSPISSIWPRTWTWPPRWSGVGFALWLAHLFTISLSLSLAFSMFVFGWTICLRDLPLLRWDSTRVASIHTSWSFALMASVTGWPSVITAL